MSVRNRIVIAALFASIFWLVPAPDDAIGRPYLGYLQVRAWLLGDNSPLQTWQDAGRPIESLAVDLRQSPPLADPAERRQRAAEYARIAEEWRIAKSRASTAASSPAPAAGPSRGSTGPTLVMSVHVGSDGVQATLPAPASSPDRAAGPESLKLVRYFPSRLSLLPMIVTIVVAILTQRVLLALLLGGLAGAFAFVASIGGAAHDASLFTQGAQAAKHWFGDALWRRSIAEDFYLQITAFVVFLFMTVGVITRNGGVHGLVTRLQRFVKGPRSAQAVTVSAGVSVFFDDYTNCLLVGSTMRPLCDRVRVAREKLAYLVDSTAAPIAGLSVFSTWVVYEMSQYQTPLAMVTRPDGTPYVPADAFSVFLDSLPYRFYSWFALLLVVIVVITGRDFGPMLKAEQRARRGADPEPAAAGTDAEQSGPADPSRQEGPDADTPLRARNAVLPLLVLILGTVGLMLAQGVQAIANSPESANLTFGPWLREVLANARSTTALLYSSITAWLLAVALTLGQRLLRPAQVLWASLRATRSLYVAFGILFFAWSLGHICSDLGTSLYLTAAGRQAMSAAALPLLLFFMAGAIAFSTGTSFGTMAILLPNVVVLAHRLGTDAAFGGDAMTGGSALMLICIGAVLEGAIFGDHCSPISDTTVLSSLGARCDLLAHVSTQLPYAMLAMITAAVCGYGPVLWAGPDAWPWCFVAGPLVMFVFLRLVGRKPDVSTAAAQT
ncbi:MAG: Na+/H+ antiporter NhaC family protein [Planctomycetota bacterium]